MLRSGLRSVFSEVYSDLSGLRAAGATPAIIVSNHTSPYDGLVAMVACAHTSKRLWVPAAPSVMRIQPYLRPLGWFAVTPGAPRRSEQQLTYLGCRAARERHRAVWFFPEGCIVRTGFQVPTHRGALVMANASSGSTLVPVAIALEFFERARPFVWLRASEPVDSEGLEGPDLRQLLDQASAALASDLAQGTGTYDPMIRDDPDTLLVANIPCDLKRVRRALATDGAHARAVMTGAGTPAEVAHSRESIGRACGSLYRGLIPFAPRSDGIVQQPPHRP